MIQQRRTTILLLMLLVCGCGGAAQQSARVTTGKGAGGAGAEAAGGQHQGHATSRAAMETTERKIIYEGEVRLVVEQDFERLEREVPKLVDDFGGYLAEASIDRTQGRYLSGHWKVRIPSERFEEFLEALEGLGTIESRRRTAEDVTEEYVDLQARIDNKQALEKRLIQLLEERTGEIKDIIKVEEELARVREEIERMQGRLRYLKNRIAFSTVTIKARLEREYSPPEVTFAGRIGRAWWESLSRLQSFGENLVIGAVAASPWVVPLIPIGWYAGRRWRRRRSSNHSS